MKLKEGMQIGMYTIIDNQVVISPAKFKVKRLRPNGTLVLKIVGEFKGVLHAKNTRLEESEQEVEKNQEGRNETT